jgi:hypothetical protein
VLATIGAFRAVPVADPARMPADSGALGTSAMVSWML